MLTARLVPMYMYDYYFFRLSFPSPCLFGSVMIIFYRSTDCEQHFWDCPYLQRPLPGLKWRLLVSLTSLTAVESETQENVMSHDCKTSDGQFPFKAPAFTNSRHCWSEKNDNYSRIVPSKIQWLSKTNISTDKLPIHFFYKQQTLE